MARVLFLQGADPAGYPPLLHAAGLFAEAGHAVCFLTSPVSHSQVTMPDIAGVRAIALPPRPSYVVSAKHYAEYLFRALRLARSWAPNVVYASDPLGALPGVLAARVARAKLVYHEHDSPNREADLKPPIRLARRRALRRADYVVFPNCERARIAAQQTGFDQSRLHIVWNVPRRHESVLALGSQELPLTLYYHGGVNAALVPQALMQAVLRFEGRVQLRVVGVQSPESEGFLDELTTLAAAAGRDGCLDLRGGLPRSELFAAMRGGHVGVALMPRDGHINMQHMVGASNKAFDYMAGGLALLVSELPDWEKMFVAPGYARACDPRDVDSIAAQIDWFIEHPQALRAMGLTARQRILDDWNYDSQFAPLLVALALN